jgi:hypothetical protein
MMQRIVECKDRGKVKGGETEPTQDRRSPCTERKAHSQEALLFCHERGQPELREQSRGPLHDDFFFAEGMQRLRR